MDRIVPVLWTCAFVGLLGCGNGTTAASQFSCDATDKGQHVCIDTIYGVASTSLVQDGKTQCTTMGGTAGDACDRTGSLGGCRVVSTTATVTTWSYGTGSSSTLMQNCTMNLNGTFVAP
jgi:hypothetical protein